MRASTASTSSSSAARCSSYSSTSHSCDRSASSSSRDRALAAASSASASRSAAWSRASAASSAFASASSCAARASAHAHEKRTTQSGLPQTCCISRSKTSAGAAAACSSCSSTSSASYAAQSCSDCAICGTAARTSNAAAQKCRELHTRLLLELFAKCGGALPAQRVVHRGLVGRHVPNLGRGLEAACECSLSEGALGALAAQRGTHVATSASPASKGVCCGIAPAPSGEGCSGTAFERMTDACEGSTTKDSSMALNAPMP